MKTISFNIVISIILLNTFLLSEIYAENKRPNVILIYSDNSLKEDLDGRSIAGVITQNDISPHEHWFWYMPSERGGQRALRKGIWKLYCNPVDPSSLQKIPDEDKEIFLSNLKDDPSEKMNFAKKHPEIVEELKVLLTQYNERLKEKNNRSQ
jgi:hypothetical protein